MSPEEMPIHKSRHVLVLSPHLDDESFGCGGTIKHLTSAGTPVDVVFMTRGERGIEAGIAPTPEILRETAKVRTSEAQEACGLLGVSKVSFLDGHDGRVEVEPKLSADVRLLLDHGDYGRVFCPWPGESHPDHRATFAWLALALQGYDRTLDVWLYEVWTPQVPNMLVPIDHTIDDKTAAAAAHKSQTRCFNYVPAFRGLAEYRSLLAPPAQYAEAFFICDNHSLPDAMTANADLRQIARTMRS